MGVAHRMPAWSHKPSTLAKDDSSSESRNHHSPTQNVVSRSQVFTAAAGDQSGPKAVTISRLHKVTR